MRKWKFREVKTFIQGDYWGKRQCMGLNLVMTNSRFLILTIKPLEKCLLL